MEANNLDDSSNQGAGEAYLGPEMNELANFLDPRVTINRPVNTISIQNFSTTNRSETRMKHIQNSESTSPDLFETPTKITTYKSHLPQTNPDRLLQVPSINDIIDQRLSPSPEASRKPGNVDGPSMPGASSNRNVKSKPLASAKKAEEVSEELASKIATFIGHYRGPTKDIQATIKEQLLLIFNPGLSRKRSAQSASLEDDLKQNKKRRVTCDQCSTTTARQCDMRYVHQNRMRDLPD